MAPTASKREQILEYVKDTILPAVIAGPTYNSTLRTIARGHRSARDLGAGEFPAVFISTTRERRENLTTNQFKGTLQVILVGYVKDSRTGTNAPETGPQKDLDKLIADLTKVLEADRLQGGLVKWTEVTEIVTDDGDLLPVAGCVVSVEFEYVSEGTNP